jgi:hypothetical protein
VAESRTVVFFFLDRAAAGPWIDRERMLDIGAENFEMRLIYR